MTFESWLAEELERNGIWDHDVPTLIGLIRADSKEMTGRWGDEISGYPAMMRNLLWLLAKRVTLKWIDENQPQAWYRPMFTDDPEAEIKKLNPQ